MTPRFGKAFRTSAQVDDLAVTQRHAAGIDVHAATHFVSVAPADVPAGFRNPDPQLPDGVRKFGTATPDLEALAAWLRGAGTRWPWKRPCSIPLRPAGRSGLDVIPGPAADHARGGKGRDVLDAVDPAPASYGLTASFRPADAIVQQRGCWRRREYRPAASVQHPSSALEEMNVKLTGGWKSDIVGQTGMKILQDIVRWRPAEVNAAS
jgi:hypothetical protein